MKRLGTLSDNAVKDEMIRTRVAAKFLPHAFVDKKQTNVASDVVNVPTPAAALAAGQPFDPALSVDESAQNRVQEYWGTFKLSVAQVDAEERQEMGPIHQMPPKQTPEGAEGHHHHQMEHHRASTAVSLAMRVANIVAQAEDLILFNGQNAVVNNPLFAPPLPTMRSSSLLPAGLGRNQTPAAPTRIRAISRIESPRCLAALMGQQVRPSANRRVTKKPRFLMCANSLCCAHDHTDVVHCF